MPRIAGAWAAASFDNDKAVSRATQDSLKKVFTSPEKLARFWIAYQGSILEYCRDALMKESAQTLSDERIISPEEASSKYARVLSCAVLVILKLLQEYHDEDTAKHQELYTDILTSTRLWELACHDDVAVRNAIHKLLRSCLLRERGAFSINPLSQILICV